MTKGTFEDFRDAMRAFESGWDKDRYESGNIQDWQLDEWAGGTVTDFYPGYSSWGDLTPDEWDAMSYRSMNSLGFVGYQFGEALLIDLGYYDDDVFYGNGASTNTWDGVWTGKNGVTSLEEFMTAEAQEQAIQEAFGYNLKIISEGLANGGESLSDYIGTTRTYLQDGEEITVTITETGLMAAAHLRGAYGTLALLQSNDVSTDEYGTSILKYIDDFGGYDSPTVDEMIAIFEETLTGDEGVGTPDGGTGTGDGSDTGSDGGTDDTSGDSSNSGDAFDNSDITSASADVVLTWAWGENRVVEPFDPENETLFIDWISADQLEITETDAGVVFTLASNSQSLTLGGVTLSALNAQNIHALDTSLRSELATLIGEGNSDGDDTGDDDQGGDDHGGGDDGHGDMTGMMYTLSLSSQSTQIDGFDPAMDMIHIEAGVTGDQFEIFEESGDALGLTTRLVITDASGTILSTTILTGVGLDDLDMGNFSIAEETTQNEIAAALGSTIDAPAEGTGYDVVYDSDGSDPATVTGTTAEGGTMYRADTNADDIVGFDASVDQIDFGGTSVHGMIVTKTAAGEVAVDSPWSAQLQIVQGVTFQDITIDTMGVVGNEHLRQDIGGVLSWELGIGPRDSGTIYVRSHEYGVSEVVDNFDVSTMKLSFLYFGTRERLSVEDTDAGLVISSLPTGQSLTLTGVTLAELQPGQVEFHHDQVMEDNLETPFGFSQDHVTLVSREGLLTPEAPEGETTDGYQTRDGVFDAPDDGGGDDSGEGGDGSPDDGDTGSVGGSGTDPDDTFVFGEGQDRAEVSWSWNTQTSILNFDADEDLIDFTSLQASDVAVSEVGDDLLIEVLNNGGRSLQFDGLQAEDLSMQNLTANDWNQILDPTSALVLQLQDLGMDLG
ncbi:hypothetical protein CSC82_09235 [Rhodobacteraceae bacterium 4F10]|nr:hypothetical protein CSC82_09235 [Rhodobacteraceae bacterium 4F10]